MTVLMSPELEGMIDFLPQKRETSTIFLSKESIISSKITFENDGKRLFLNVILNKGDIEEPIEASEFSNLEISNLFSNVTLKIESIDITYYDHKEFHTMIVCKIIRKEKSNE